MVNPDSLSNHFLLMVKKTNHAHAVEHQLRELLLELGHLTFALVVKNLSNRSISMLRNLHRDPSCVLVFS